MGLAVEDLASMENRKSGRVPSRMRCWCEGENVTLYSRVMAQFETLSVVSF